MDFSKLREHIERECMRVHLRVQMYGNFGIACYMKSIPAWLGLE